MYPQGEDRGYFDADVTRQQYGPGSQGEAHERGAREFMRIFYLYLPLLLAWALVMWWARTLPFPFWLIAWALSTWMLVRMYLFRGSYRAFAARLIGSIKDQIPHFVEFVRLAFGKKDDRTTLALAHRQLILSGRSLSPIRILSAIPIIIALGGVAFGFWGWRNAEAASRTRDAGCTEQELDGETTRQACRDVIDARQQRDLYAEAHGNAVEEVAARNRQIEAERAAHALALDQAAARAIAEVNARERNQRRSIEREGRSSGVGRIDPVERLRSLSGGQPAGDGGGADTGPTDPGGAGGLPANPGADAGVGAAGNIPGA